MLLRSQFMQQLQFSHGNKTKEPTSQSSQSIRNPGGGCDGVAATSLLEAIVPGDSISLDIERDVLIPAMNPKFSIKACKCTVY